MYEKFIQERINEFQFRRIVLLFRPLRDIRNLLCQQVRVKEQVDVETLLRNGQAMDPAPVEAEGFFISKGRGRDTAFYKTVPPFERHHKF